MSEEHKEEKGDLFDFVTDAFTDSKYVVDDSIRVFGACVFNDMFDEDKFLQTCAKEETGQFRLEEDFLGWHFLVDKKNDKVFHLYCAYANRDLGRFYSFIEERIEPELWNQVHLFEGMMGGADRIMLDCGIYRGKINVDQ